MVRLLGVEVLAISTNKAAEYDDQPGDITTYPLGFVARTEVPLEYDMPDLDP